MGAPATGIFHVGMDFDGTAMERLGLILYVAPIPHVTVSFDKVIMRIIPHPPAHNLDDKPPGQATKRGKEMPGRTWECGRGGDDIGCMRLLYDTGGIRRSTMTCTHDLFPPQRGCMT